MCSCVRVRDPALQITVRMVPCTDYEPDPEAVRKMRVHKEVPHPPRPLSRPTVRPGPDYLGPRFLMMMARLSVSGTLHSAG